MSKITSGTKEWADTNVNIFHGCSNDCLYCYAKKMAIRFNRKTEENWKAMDLNMNEIGKRYKKRSGRIMFPTSHDITVKSLFFCLATLQKLLYAGNEVLITTKPDYKCMKILLRALKEYKDQIQFRFTITSLEQEILKDWESAAPSYKSRLASLIKAFIEGYKTSVAIEPFLDFNPIPLILTLVPYVTETVWIGKLNYHKTNFNSWRNIKKVINNIRILPEHIKNKIRIKDSIVNLYAKHGEKLILN